MLTWGFPSSCWRGRDVHPVPWLLTQQLQGAAPEVSPQNPKPGALHTPQISPSNVGSGALGSCLWVPSRSGGGWGSGLLGLLPPLSCPQPRLQGLHSPLCTTLCGSPVPAGCCYHCCLFQPSSWPPRAPPAATLDSVSATIGAPLGPQEPGLPLPPGPVATSTASFLLCQVPHICSLL